MIVLFGVQVWIVWVFGVSVHLSGGDGFHERGGSIEP
jgi:hypothetical protein